MDEVEDVTRRTLAIGIYDCPEHGQFYRRSITGGDAWEAMREHFPPPPHEAAPCPECGERSSLTKAGLQLSEDGEALDEQWREV